MNSFSDPKTQATDRSPGFQLVQQLKGFYEQFAVDQLARLNEFYTSDVEFRDPVHTLHGCLAVRHYMRKLAGGLTLYRIRYIDEAVGPNSAYLTWEMDYAHRKVNRGQTVTVRGMSLLKFTDKVYYHEDCYDLGALVYEHLPLFGRIVRSLKKRLAG